MEAPYLASCSQSIKQTPPPPKRRRVENSEDNIETSILKITTDQTECLQSIASSLKIMSVTMLNIETLMYDLVNKTNEN